jgi:hypothetical protein
MVRRLTGLYLLTLFAWNAAGQTIQPQIRLKGGILSSANSLLNHKINHPLWQSARLGEDYFVLVQMSRIAGSAEKLALENQGIRLVSYLSGKSYLAILKKAPSPKEVSQTGILNIFQIPSSLKLSASLLHGSLDASSNKDLIAVSCYPLDKKTIERMLTETGAELVDTKIKPYPTWFVRCSLPVLEKLARLPFVTSISPIHLQDIALNYNSHALHSVNALCNQVGRNLHGENLVLGIGDNADPSTHIDLAGKLIMRTDEPVDDHGTHTSGILAGGGILNPLYAGMAPRARLVVNDFSDILVNSPTYVADYQMPLTNNSYYNGSAGCPGDGDYNALSNYVDSQMISFPKLLHVFAAGNDGPFTCSPLPTSYGTIKSGFQTGKNILTVGSMNYVTYGIGGGSSWGPVADGRIKPEIVASGVDVISTTSYNNYAAFIGTSMASPTAAGILALIVERYRQLHGGQYPDGALLKALVTNSADDLGNPGPDFTFGFGMINARTTVEALEQNHYFSGTVANNGSQQFTIPALPTGAYQLKILLYWTDPPAQPMAAAALVNDLDLQVTDPSGTSHLPLILDPSPGGVSANAKEGADHVNNIEQVVITNPVSGNYTLNVAGNSVPDGPQSFYLAYEIIEPSVKIEYPFGGETWVPGQTETIRWSAYSGDPNTFSLEFSSDGGNTWNMISNSIASSDRSYAWVVPPLVTNQSFFRLTRNISGYQDTNSYPFTILNQPTLTVTNTCPGYAQLNWNSISGADSYDILKLALDTMQVIANTPDTSFLTTSLDQQTSYWFAVRAVHAGIAGRRSVAVNIIPNLGSCTDTGLNNDLLVDSVLTPVTGRQFTSTQPGNEQISIRIRNPGNLATVSPVSCSFQVNGSSPVTEINAAPMPAHSSTIYTFSPANRYDFSAAGNYVLRAWIHYAPDTIPGNDTISTRIKTLRNDPLMLNPSYTESFESATDQSYNSSVQGLDSLDRSDFANSVSNGRLNTFFNSGFARTGARSILLDVTELGISAADSLTNTFNLSNYTASDQVWLDLYFKKQSIVPALSGNQVWIRGNDQAAWIAVKNLSDPSDLPGNYIKLNLDLRGILAGASPAQTISSSFQVKCGSEGFTPAGSSNPAAAPGGGISFDDFILTNAQNDVGMLGLVQPSLKNVCSLGNAEQISVLIRNYASVTQVNIPVTYIVNQDTVTESIAALLPNDSLLYTFSRTVDMSAYQAYHIKTWVSNPADNYRNNDSSADYIIQTSPLISQFPYLEGFENNNGYWYSGGINDSWQWGKPAKTIIHKAANGTNAWVTSLTGNYNDNEYSFLYSPCFDLTSLTRPVLSFSHIFQTEDDCNCDYHWVEYSLDDSAWTILGNNTSGVNWYDDSSPEAWQKSDPQWHVSSYDIPVIAPKIRFRIVMYSDPGTNFEGVGIDDIHVFEKAPVFTDSLLTSMTQPVSGSNWIDFDENGTRILSINANGQDLGTARIIQYKDTFEIRDTAGQYYGERNWVIQTSNPSQTNVSVRYYFTDSEANKLIHATGCASCLNAEDAYSFGVTQYASPKLTEEDSTLQNNRNGSYVFLPSQKGVQIIPFDNGYYAETTQLGFGEFWINAGGRNQDHPLAAWLKDFTATLSNSTGVLTWTSWQEENSTKYIIEKSNDSLQFNAIGSVASLPHLDSIQSYVFTDQALWNGNNYYRLVLYFNDGDSVISPIQKLEYDLIPDSVQVFPNPTTGDITIKTPSTCREIQIFDVLGRKLMDRSAPGMVEQVSIGAFSPGVYFLKLFTDSGNKLIKLEKR